MILPLQFASLYDRQVFVWSDCLLDLGTDFLIGNMVFVGDVYKRQVFFVLSLCLCKMVLAGPDERET